MTLYRQLIIITMVVIGTLITRFLPFLLFSGKETPKFVKYLGEYLPGAVFAMLVVYCLKNVSIIDGSHGIPEAISLVTDVLLHLWKRQMLLSISIGTVLYMILIQTVF